MLGVYTQTGGNSVGFTLAGLINLAEPALAGLDRLEAWRRASFRQALHGRSEGPGTRHWQTKMAAFRGQLLWTRLAPISLRSRKFFCPLLT